MNFAVYLPNNPEKSPVLIYLSGLTCTEQNVITKSGFQKLASELNIAVVCPDTSPRGLNLPGEDDSWDFGTGAGFYLNATKEPYDKNYKMEDYVTEELIGLLNTEFSDKVDTSKMAITGHSMGGHGALTLFLKNPDLFTSCSAFSPIVNPLKCPWGEKAFNGYLKNGIDEAKESGYDACELLKEFHHGKRGTILIDQGLNDNFYENQLLSKNILDAGKENKNGSKLEVNLRLHEGYDHSYYFISSFMDDHLRHHAKYF